MEVNAYISCVAIALLIILCIQSLDLIRAYRYRRVNLVARNRFRLFAIRDQFVRLVATGDLEEKDEVYRYFVSFLNILIRNTQQINFRIFIRAIRIATDEKLADESNFEKILKSVKQKNNPEVIKAVEELPLAVLAILWDNSLSVRLIMRLKKKMNNTFLYNHKQQVKPLILKYTKAYDLYETYEGMATASRAAA